MTNTDGTIIAYKYDVDGIRTSKTVNGVTTKYTTINGKITSQTDGTNSLYFFYDSNDELFGADINGTNYIYVKNIQGDIIAITDVSGTIVVRYTYDAWGNATSITGSLASTIGQLNPMRYRSYYYDSETGYYYLQSRYYEPEMGRFINSDEPVIISLGTSSVTNLFAYCNNNPVTNYDPNGYFLNSICGTVVGAGAGWLSAVISGGDKKASVISGAVSGLISGIGLDIAVITNGAATWFAVISGMISGFANESIYQWMTKKPNEKMNVKSLVFASTIGAVFNFLGFKGSKQIGKAVLKVGKKSTFKIVVKCLKSTIGIPSDNTASFVFTHVLGLSQTTVNSIYTQLKKA